MVRMIVPTAPDGGMDVLSVGTPFAADVEDFVSIAGKQQSGIGGWSEGLRMIRARGGIFGWGASSEHVMTALPANID